MSRAFWVLLSAAALLVLLGCGDEDDAWLSIDSPCDGDCWATGSVKSICWSARDVSNVRIELSRNGGQDWVEIAPSVPASAGEYEWTVYGAGPPGLPKRDCVIRVSDVSGGPSATVGIAIWGGAWRVDAGAAPGGDGLSWDQALQHPQDAVDLAVAGDEIWVAESVYTRRESGDFYVLRMAEGVSVYGGFGGTEEAVGARDLAVHSTSLDGEGTKRSDVSSENGRTPRRGRCRDDG